MKTNFFLTFGVVFLATTLTASAQARKPISKVPYEITKPGNYYLAKDLTVPANAPATTSWGIRIDADNVTLDLNGRTLSNASTTSRSGVVTKGNQANIRIWNGAITDFNTGIYLAGSGPSVLEDLAIRRSEHVGIWVAGSNVEIRRCTVHDTGPGTSFVQGIRVEGNYGAIEDCRVVGFTRQQANVPVHGIYLASGELLLRRNLIQSRLAAAAMTTGIESTGECLVTENLLSGWAAGLQLANDVYRGNAAFVCTTKYVGGNDGGSNK